MQFLMFVPVLPHNPMDAGETGFVQHDNIIPAASSAIINTDNKLIHNYYNYTLVKIRAKKIIVYCVLLA
jgi:hypothetical protein